MRKLNKIIRCNILQTLAVGWIEDAMKTGAFTVMDRKDKNEHLDSLYHFSNQEDTKLSRKADELYNSVIENPNDSRPI